MNTCSQCRFYHVRYEHQTAVGYCRRRAPVVVGEFGVSILPKVDASFWCGEFELKPELRHCQTCGNLVGDTSFLAPHLKHATLYPICKTCYDQFVAGSHTFQLDQKP